MSLAFLKWAGGKRWLVTTNQLPLPDQYSRYIEPFLGGGAVFFHLRPNVSLLADTNQELTDLYAVIRDNPAALLEKMGEHQTLHCSKHYYEVRNWVPHSLLERAARTLYLNRTCWNGLYRVNLRGEFNVPIGTKQTVVFDGEDFMEYSRALQFAEVRCSDFAETILEAGEGDFLFVDPPYTVQHNLNGFLKYNERIFSWTDQVRLRDAVSGAIRRGASLVMTNADHASVRALYIDIGEYRMLERYSVLAGSSSKRGLTSEAMFTANL